MLFLMLTGCFFRPACPDPGTCDTPADAPNQGTWNSTSADEAELTVEGDTVTVVYTDEDGNSWEATYRR